MPEQIPDPLSGFFLLTITYSLERLVVLLGDGADRPLLEVSFSPPRAFRAYAESDYWRYLNDFRGNPLIDTTDRGSGVEMSSDAPYLLDYRANAREQEGEETLCCLIRTPDQCVEVVCLEEPTLRRL